MSIVLHETKPTRSLLDSIQTHDQSFDLATSVYTSQSNMIRMTPMSCSLLLEELMDLLLSCVE